MEFEEWKNKLTGAELGEILFRHLDGDRIDEALLEEFEQLKEGR